MPRVLTEPTSGLFHVAGPVEQVRGIGVAENSAPAGEDVVVALRSKVQRCLRCDLLLPDRPRPWRVGQRVGSPGDCPGRIE